MAKDITDKSLNRFNLWLAFLHAAQGVAVLILSREFTLPVTTNYLTFDAGTQSLNPSSEQLFSLSLPGLVAAFFFLSALAHLIVATVYRDKYESDLRYGINRARWYEYSLSASVMIVAIAMLVGIYDIAILVSVFVLTSVMNLMGLVMEVTNQKSKKPNWLSYNIGVLAGAVPWLIIGWYFWANNQYGDANPPTFVYWIFVSIFIFFSSFALNMWLQYMGIGKWKNYLYGERAYMILSLVAKSALAWQVFGGTLRPL